MKKKVVCVSKSALSRKAQGTHGRRSSLPGKAINRGANMQYYVRVVADIGGDADYTTQPRYCVPVHLPFMPSNRSSARQLQLLQGKVQGHLKRCLPAGTDFHAWLFDPQTDQPGLFVTGLLAVREGHCTKSEADALNRQLMPQVFGEQPVQPFRFLVSVTARAWDWRDDSDDSSEYGEDAEYELLDAMFGGFEEYCLLDADVDDVSIHIFAECWHAISLDLPFTPTPKSSAVQLRYIESGRCPTPPSNWRAKSKWKTLKSG